MYYNVNFIINIYTITCLKPNSVKLSSNHKFNPKREGKSVMIPYTRLILNLV